MKKLILICLSLVSLTVWADERYSLSVLGSYSYNKTWGSFANLDVKAMMPVNKNIELEARVELSTTNVYTMTAVVRPKFALPVGELFADVQLYYRSYVRANQWDYVTALSLGYRMDYVSAQIGFFSRVMDVYKREWHSEAAYNSEPFNLLYRLQVNCRPTAENWNIWLAATNIDDYQIERAWAPFVQIGARYDVNEHWRVLVDGELKLAGMFHMNAELYSAYVRAGFAYTF